MGSPEENRVHFGRVVSVREDSGLINCGTLQGQAQFKPKSVFGTFL